MNLKHSSEISLRSAVFNAQKTIKKGENLAEKIKTQALGQMELVQQAEGLFSGVKNAETIQSAAISIATKGIELAYQAISDELTEARFKRKRFVEECETHLATFTISSAKEISEYSVEEHAIKRFYEMVRSKCPDIIEYFGMHVHQSEESPQEVYYAVLPFYRMSLALQQNTVIASKIDAHRQAIFLFLKTGLPLPYYYNKYKNYHRLWLQLQGIFNSKNYLNHLKAPRFIVSALANLLWNLQHPVNPQTGIPLSLIECVSICHQASMFMNELLNPSQFEFLPYLDSHSKHLSQNLSRTELLIKSLQSAFEYDRLHEINLSDISKHMHSALRIMSNKLLELIYQDEYASEKLVGQIMLMGELLMQNHDLYTYFHPLQEEFNPRACNEKARTLIDVITLFAHQTPSARNRVCQELINTGAEAHIQFAYQLREFHESFLDKFEGIVIMNLKIPQLEMKEIFKKTARHFIPLIILVMESFTVFRDTRPKKVFEHNTSPDVDESIYDLQNTAHDRKQRKSILEDAASAESIRYYNWSLSKFLKVKSAFHDSLDHLLAYQNDIRLQTQSLDEVAFKVSENRALLLKFKFKDALIEQLESHHQFFTSLNTQFNDVESKMHADLKLHRDQKRVLQPMLDELEATIQAIQKSISMVKTIISSKNFEEKEIERVAERLGATVAYRTSPKGAASSHAEAQFFSRNPKQTTRIEESSSDDATPELLVEKIDNILPRPLTNSLFNSHFIYQVGLLNLFALGVIFLVNTFWAFLAISQFYSLMIAISSLSITTAAIFYESITPEDLKMPIFTLRSSVALHQP
jgi:hypothetical protein